MSNHTRCGALTRRGRPCRNAALPQSDPPRCARHRVAPDEATQSPLPGLLLEEPIAPASASARSVHRRETPADDDDLVPTKRYLPGLSPQELDALELEGLAPDLQRELQEVRLVMYRLLRLWDDAEPPLSSEEARRLATLVFSGARTVAHLLNQQAGSGDARGWLKGALDQVAAEYDIDL